MNLRQELDEPNSPEKISPKRSTSDKLSRQSIAEGIKVSAGRFPIRLFLTIILIILTTYEVHLVLSSEIYLRGDLLRSFLSAYVNDDTYGQIFDGQNFYLEITNITELQQNLKFIFSQMVLPKQQQFLGIDFNKTKISLQIDYTADFQSGDEPVHYRLTPQKGIIQPFNMHNITDIQIFLLEIVYFKILVEDIVITIDGFTERYMNEIVYQYEEGNEIIVNFNFEIDSTMLDTVSPSKPQYGYTVVLRIFYGLVTFLAIISLYFNYTYIRRTFRQFYRELDKNAQNTKQRRGHSHRHSHRRRSIFDEFPKEEVLEINDNIMKWIKEEEITLNEIKWTNYVSLIQFHTYFSVLSNLFQIIGNIYLLFGKEHEAIIGLSCLMAWLTIFKFIRKHQNLVLMYELIKLSLTKITFFFVSMVIIFMGYALLGMCLYPKVIYFSSMSKSVTTLASMMAGDSIRMFTSAICQKYSSTGAMLYIFSYVIMFMHAIHNMLTSILKEYFLMKKMEIIQKEKSLKKEEKFIYVAEIKTSQQKIEEDLPLKMTERFEKQLIRAGILRPINHYTSVIKKIFRVLEEMQMHETWEVIDHELSTCRPYEAEIENRLKRIGELYEKIGEHIRQLEVRQAVNYVGVKASQLTSMENSSVLVQ